jgi:anti-sigma factor RsiW
MTPAEPELPIDSALVAWLDKELAPAARDALAVRLAEDSALRARLEQLRAGARPFAAAFEVLLQDAPEARLAAALERSLRSTNSRHMRWRRLSLAAAAVLLFVLGGAAGHFLPAVIEGGDEVAADGAAPEGWRQVVAEYLTLYTRETLAGIPDDPGLRAQELSLVGARLALDLDPGRIALPDLRLKRAQLFEVDGRPLAQIAYLSERDGPIAFCIIGDGADGTQPRRFEQRLGSNIVYWAKGGRGYMLIGKAPRQELEAFAATLAQRVS